MAGARRWGVVLAAWLLVAGACARDDATGSGAGGEAADADEPAVSDPGDVGPRASAGCDAATAPAPGEERVTLPSGAQERWYLRHLPPGYDGTEPLPLVVDFHGYSEGAEVHAGHSELGAFGDERGFVTLSPHGRGEVPFWDTAPGGVDVTFAGDLLDHAAETLCLDLARVYVAGLSNGAMMTSVVACVYADRVAAAAPVAGVADVGGCEPERPVPVVGFHGTDDPFLAYEGGFGPAVSLLPAPDGEGTLGDLDEDDAADAADSVGQPEAPSVPDAMAAWAERNGCDGGDPQEAMEADDVTVLTYPCPEGAEVELYRIEGGGHTWPGSPFLDGVELVGATTFSISANEVMWAFFEDHALPE